MIPLPQRLRCQYDGDFYLMDLSRDRFVHFTTRDRAAEIMESGRLLMRPPYKGFGIDAVAAVSTVWGSFLPEVQTTHIDADKSDLVGVVFQTKVMPEVGYPEEVLWKQDVVLVNPKVVPYAKAKGMIRGSSDFDGQVYYEVPSWCDGVEGRVASRYTPAESAAISLLQDAPDESVEDLIEQVLRARRLFDPVSRTFVDAKEVAEALRGMAPEPYKVPGGVSVYHATDASTARLLTRRGFIPQTKPRNLTDTYAPGRGVDQGLYVGATPRSVEGYGRVTLEVTVPRKHLSVPTELTQLGETNPMKALKSHDGAVINHPIPAEAFRVVRGRLASPTRVASLSGFMSDYQRETAEPENPRSRNHRVWWDESMECAVHTDIGPGDHRVWRDRAHLNIIQIGDPDCTGRGRAADVMKRLVRMADRHKIEMSLSPEAVGGKNISTSGLSRWYKRLGFHPRGMFEAWVREPGGMPPVDDAKWEVQIERPSGDEVFDYYAESFDEAHDHALSLADDSDFLKGGEVTAFRRDGGRWRKLASPTTSTPRIARVSPRIKEAIEESMANLPDRLRQAVDIFSAGVIMGKAPSLEQHTSALYKAFAPLRDALGGTATMYRGQPINPPKIERKWLSWTTEPRMAARFTGNRGDQIIEAKVKSSDVVAGILSPRNPNYIEFLVKNRPEYQTRSPKQVPIYYALYMPLNPRFYDDMPENFSDLSDREQLEFSYPGWKRWLDDNERAVERAGGKVMHSDPPKYDDSAPFLGVLMPADVGLPPALAALDDAKYGRPMPRYMGKVASAARVASRFVRAGLLDVPPKVADDVYQWCMERLCSEWLEHELPYKRAKIHRELDGADGWQRDFQEKRLVNLGLVEREAKKWGRAGASFRGQQGNTWRGHIDTDLSGWRYASEIRTRTGKTPNELAKEMGKDRFFLTLRNNEKLDGTWTPSTTTRGWAMEIKINFDPHDLKTWRSRTQELRKVITHETGHLTQSYLDLLLNLGTPGENVPTSGLPGSDLAEPGYDPLGNKLTLYGNPIAEMHGREDHALREVEFYTRLRDDVDDFVRMTKRIPKDAWREALRVWVGADERSYSDPLRFRVPGEMSRDVRNSDFFKTIKQNRRKWQKAVSLFVDEVGKRVSIPSAVRVASPSPRGVAARYAATTPLPPAFPKGEPGLMTSKEFIEFRNPGGKSHPDDAYDFDLEKMNKDHSFQTHESKFDGYSIEENNKGAKITRDGKLVAVVHNGTMYLENTSHKGKIITEWRDRRGEEHDLGVKTYKKVKYLSEKMPLISPVARNNFGDYPVLLQNLIVKGEPMTMRAEKQPGLNEKVNLAILNAEGLEVAVAQNEWGATLFVVAQEYRGRGLGKIIGKKWYELNPASTSGGFSNSGYANALALWEGRVKEFMGRGWYSELIREGTLTHQQVKAILAGIGERPPRPEPEPEEVQPTGDILTYVAPENSDFIVYDRAFFDDPDERFIHGYGFLRSQPRIGPYFFALDYDQPYADLVNRTGLQMARDGGDDRLYDGEGYSDTLELNGLPGIERDGDHITITQDLLPGLAGLASEERRIRKERDSYDEKFYLLQEQAASKWR